MSIAEDYAPPFDWGAYFLWLCEKVDIADRGDHFNWFNLARTLMDTEFVAIIPGDRNRMADGVNLRYEFSQEENLLEDTTGAPCSVLELLVALCLRVERNITGEPGNDHPEIWFWQMMHNLGIDSCDDNDFDRAFVEQQIGLWMDHLYAPDGTGGILPLKNPFGDQRNLEIWVQMQQYLNENFDY